MRLPRLAPAAIALVLATAPLAGCGDDDEGSTGPEPTAGPPSTAASTTTAPEATDPSPTSAEPSTTTATTAAPLEVPEGEGLGEVEDFAQDLLLSVADLGEGFVDLGYTPDVGPCAVDIDAAEAPDAVVGTRLGREADGVEVLQELRVYPDADAAGRAFAALAGSCTAGTDRTAEVGVDAFSAELGGAVVVVALVSDGLASFSVAGPGPDPVAVAVTGLQKIVSTSQSG